MAEERSRKAQKTSRADKGKRKASSSSHHEEEEFNPWKGWSERHMSNLSVPAFPEVKFTSKEQYEKFKGLQVHPFQPTRYFCHTTLRNMNILNRTREFFCNLGLESLFDAYHASYQGLTLEFLSSLQEGKNKIGERAMIFRLNNTTYSATNEQLAEIFDLPTSAPSGRKDEQTDFPLQQVWRWVSGKILLNYSHLYASDAQHPLFRLFFKFCRESLFASPNSHQIRQTDLYLLAKYLNPNPHCDRYMPSALWKHLFNVSNARGTQPICVGGHVTRIAEAFGLEFEYEPVAEALFDYDHLYRSRYLLARKDEHGPYKWIVSPHCTFNLSRNAGNLPPIFPKPEDPSCFLLDGVPIPEPEQMQADVNISASGGPSTSSLREPAVEAPLNQPSQGFSSADPPQWFSNFSSEIMGALGNIQTSISQLQLDNRDFRGEIAHLRERQDMLWEEQQRFQRQAFYPVYDHAFHSGWIRPGAPLPPWFEPPSHIPLYIYGSCEAGGSGGGGQNPGLGGSGDGGSGGVFGGGGGDYGGVGGGDGGDDDSAGAALDKFFGNLSGQPPFH